MTLEASIWTEPVPKLLSMLNPESRERRSIFTTHYEIYHVGASMSNGHDRRCFRLRCDHLELTPEASALEVCLPGCRLPGYLARTVKILQCLRDAHYSVPVLCSISMDEIGGSLSTDLYYGKSCQICYPAVVRAFNDFQVMVVQPMLPPSRRLSASIKIYCK